MNTLVQSAILCTLLLTSCSKEPTNIVGQAYTYGDSEETTAIEFDVDSKNTVQSATLTIVKDDAHSCHKPEALQKIKDDE